MPYDVMATHNPRVVFIGSGTRGPFTLNDSSGNPIRIRSTAHLVVRRYASVTDETGTALAVNTDFTANLTDVDAVTITLTSAQAVLASTERLVVTRLQSLADVISLSSGGNFSAEALSAAMSVLTEELQEARRDIDRSLKVDWRETAEQSLPIAPTSVTKLLGRATDGSVVHLEIADIDAIEVGLGSGWAPVLAAELGSTWPTLLGNAYTGPTRASWYETDVVTGAAAVNAALATGAKHVIVDVTCTGTTPIVISGDYVTLEGEVRGDQRQRTITYSGTGDAISVTSAFHVNIRNLNIEHTGTAGKCIDLEDGEFHDISFCRLAGTNVAATDPLLYTRGSYASIKDNEFYVARAGAAYCVEVDRTSADINIETVIEDNVFGGTGQGIFVHASGGAARPEGIRIEGNSSILTGDAFLDVRETLELRVINNTIDQCQAYGIVLSPGTQNIDGVLISNNWISPYRADATNGVGIYLNETAPGNCVNIDISNNDIQNAAFGVAAKDNTASLIISDNRFSNISNCSVDVENAGSTTISGNTVLFAGTTNFILLDGASGGPFIVTDNQWDGTKPFTLTMTDKRKFRFARNMGVRIGQNELHILDFYTSYGAGADSAAFWAMIAEAGEGTRCIIDPGGPYLIGAGTLEPKSGLDYGGYTIFADGATITPLAACAVWFDITGSEIIWDGGFIKDESGLAGIAFRFTKEEYNNYRQIVRNVQGSGQVGGSQIFLQVNGADSGRLQSALILNYWKLLHIRDGGVGFHGEDIVSRGGKFGVHIDTASTITVTASVGDGFTIASNVLTRQAGGAQSFISDGILVDAVVTLGAFTTNNGRVCRVTARTATTLTLSPIDGGGNLTDIGTPDTNATVTTDASPHSEGAVFSRLEILPTVADCIAFLVDDALQLSVTDSILDGQYGTNGIGLKFAGAGGGKSVYAANVLNTWLAGAPSSWAALVSGGSNERLSFCNVTLAGDNTTNATGGISMTAVASFVFDNVRTFALTGVSAAFNNANGTVKDSDFTIGSDPTEVTGAIYWDTDGPVPATRSLLSSYVRQARALAATYTQATGSAVASGSGSLTDVSAAVWIKRIGKLIETHIEFTNTNNGTGAGSILIPLPIAPKAATTQIMPGRTSGLVAVTAGMTGTSQVQVVTATGTYPTGTGVSFIVDGHYEAA